MKIQPRDDGWKNREAPVGTRIYAIGDIHGRHDLLVRLLDLVARDAEAAGAARNKVVFLGDYIDRGPKSRDVVELLLRGPAQRPEWRNQEWICLKGNHEEAMLDFLAEGVSGPGWLLNGGLACAASYCGQLPPFEPGALPLNRLREALLAALPDSHRAFLARLPYFHIEGDYLFVHAGLRPGLRLEEQSPADMMWIREEFLSSPLEHGHLVVHGHTISALPDIRPNRIGIDTGAFATGRLTALVVQGSLKSFLNT